jgi:hypothetical protein
VTDVLAFNASTQVEVPLHAPDQPAKVEPEEAAAVSVTDVPVAKLAVQALPQLMPAGLLVTVPEPVPASCTVSCTCEVVAVLNVAVTDAATESVTVHAAVPLQAPDHPAKLDPDAGVAVSVTVVPLSKLAEHVCPQLMPAGLLVTVPVPVPTSCTVSCTCGVADVLKVAVTEAASERVTVQAAVPLHAPDHPVNVDSDAGAAVSVTAVPVGKLAEHVWPQLIPEGLLVTLPDPVPVFETVSCT